MRSLTFLLVLFAIAYAAAKVDHCGTPLNGFVFNGVISGLFAVLGVVFGVAEAKLPQRLRRYHLVSSKHTSTIGM